MEPINLEDFAVAARRSLRKMTWDYYAGGALDGRTLSENRAAWGRIRLRHRVLRGVGERSTAASALGMPLSFPLLVAPMAFQAMAHPEGELATARAAAAAGVPMCLSTLSNHPVEEVVEAGGGGLLFQLYVYRDRGLTRALVERAEAAGAEALVLTVDAPVLGTREADRRNRFHLPPGLEMANLFAEGHRALPRDAGDSGLAAYVADLIDDDLDWEVVDWLRGLTDLPLVLKGVVHPEDAREAARRGAAAVVVSNHGGRQLDGGAATAALLPEVAEAVAGELEVWVDGGIRRGGDVLRAIALGADAVMLGRPVLWGLAVDGQRGVERVLAILRAELEECMALCGCRSVDGISRDLVFSGP